MEKMPFRILDTSAKSRQKQLRWLCVSPYLLLSLITVGISFPLAVSLLNASNTVLTEPAKTAHKAYTFQDLLQTIETSQFFQRVSLFETSRSQITPSATNSIKNRTLPSTHDVLVRHKELFTIPISNRLTSKFLTKTSFLNNSLDSYNSYHFSFHPKIRIFYISYWISHLFSLHTNNNTLLAIR